MQKSIIKEILKNNICIQETSVKGAYVSLSSSYLICLIYTIQKIYLQWLWLEGKETQEATGLMREPPDLH